MRVLFGSKIHVLPTYPFLVFRNGLFLDRVIPSAGPPYTHAKRIQHASEGFTERAYRCNILSFHNVDGVVAGLNNPGHMSMAHLSPWEVRKANWPFVEAALESDIQALKEESPDLHGFLTGGHRHHKNSRRLKNLLLDLMKRWEIPCSILWGQRFSLSSEPQPSGPTAVHYSVKSDTWTVHVNINMDKDVKDIRSAHDLRRAFSVVRIADGDQLFIGDQAVQV